MNKVKNFFGPEAMLFGALFFLLGLIFVFVTPPIYTVDESTHWYRSYQVSELKLISDNVLVSEAGGEMPAAVTQFVTMNMREPGEKFTFSDDTEKQLKLETSDVRDEVEFTNVAIYPPVNYMPQAIGISIARLFTPKVLIQFYAAKVTNLIFLTCMLMMAIKLLPYGKKAGMVLASLPMVMYAGSSLSADAWVIGTIFLFMAYFMRLMTREKIYLKQWLIIAALAGAVALSKQTYVILTLTLFALPFRGQKWNKSDLLKVAGAVGFAFICLGVWLLLVRDMNSEPVRLQESAGIYANSAYQLDFLLHHPLYFIKLLFLTMNNGGIFNGFLAVFGVADVPLPPPFYFALVLTIFLGFGILKDSPRKAMRITPSLIIVSVVALHIIATLAGLYVFWTTPGYPGISGVQGRYFIPDLIMLLPVLLSRYRHTISQRVVVGSAFGILGVSVIVIIARFFGLPT
ncbi:MAG: DUF2142 domain-containing protein [Candidatus Saccharimonadales bacterium]